MSDAEPTGNPAIFRQAIAVLALIAGLVALYLHLVKIGTFGLPACGPGHGCVQAWYSPWGSFLGLDVALIGAVGYAVLMIVAFVGGLDYTWRDAVRAVGLCAGLAGNSRRAPYARQGRTRAAISHGRRTVPA